MHEFGPDLQVVLPLIASVCSFNVTFFWYISGKGSFEKESKKEKTDLHGTK